MTTKQVKSDWHPQNHTMAMQLELLFQSALTHEELVTR